jgi:predicted dehydrogenase
MNKVRMGVVGMGMGRWNGRAIARNPRSAVTALCDLFEDRMQEYARELPEPVKFYTDYKQLCRDPEIDAIFVGTPNQMHVPVALEALRNGKHVLITKPLSDSLDAARTLVDEAERSRLVAMMSLTIRYEAETQHLGTMSADGQFGEIYYARSRSVRRSGIPSWSLGFVDHGGGAWRDMGVHMLDAAWWIMGRPHPVSVLGVAGAKFGPRGRGYWDFQPEPPNLAGKFVADDYGGGLIRFANGAGLQVESFWASHQRDEVKIELFGTELGATLEYVDPKSGKEPLHFFRTVNGLPETITTSIPRRPDSIDTLTEHFIACILDGAECQAPVRDGLIVQEMLEALLQSAATGREVRFG